MTDKTLLEVIPAEMQAAKRWILVNDKGKPVHKAKNKNYFPQCPQGEYINHLITLAEALYLIAKAKNKISLGVCFVTGETWGEFTFPDIDENIILNMKKPSYREHYYNENKEDAIHIIGQCKDDYTGDAYLETRIIQITGAKNKEDLPKEQAAAIPIDTVMSIMELKALATATSEPSESGNDDNILPEWIIETEYNGRITRKINEPLFCKVFREENPIVRINGVFYLDGKQVSDDLILSMVQKKISPYFVERTGRKTNDIFITLQNNSYVQQPTPNEHKIYCGNDLTITIDDNGQLSFDHEEIFTLSRLAVDYNPEADCPTFIKYLNDLLYEEDIQAVQEYVGYCLIPSTRAQAGLFIHGQGGEGKSVLRDVMMRLFNHGAVQEGIHQLSERFVIANLETKLVCIDDDMRSDKLNDTAVIKKLITNSPTSPIQVERKNKQKYDSFVYARIFAIGNTFIGSKFDHSDGFYRRQLLIDCKPKTRPEEQDDRRMSDKCIAEINGIFNWALAGLIGLVKNGYHFTVSERMKRTLDDVKHEGNNSLTFFEDKSVIDLIGDWTETLSTVDLFTAYALWCFDNGETPIRRRSFMNTASERYKIYKIRFFDKDGIRRQGFTHLKLSEQMENRITYLDDKTANKIERLP